MDRGSSRPTAVDAPDAWAALEAEVDACRACPLGSARTRTVFYRGGRRPRVVFVGEAPGAEEDRTGVPFVGRSGRRLDAAVARLPLGADDVGVLNVLKCRPPANRFDAACARACRPFLERQLDLLRPRVLVPLGARALTALDATAPRILEASGRPRARDGGWLFPLLHPAAALRSTRLAARWDGDVGALAAWLPSVVG